MKFNDDSLMFDLDSSCLDHGGYDTIDNSYPNQFVDFVCEDLEQFSNLNTIKTCTLIDEIDLFGGTTVASDVDFGAEFCDFTDSLFGSNSNLNFSSNPTNNLSNHNSSSSPSQSSPLATSLLSNSSPAGSDRSSDASPFDFHSFSGNSQACNEIEANSEDKREVKKKLLNRLLDLTQRKLTHTLCFDSKLRNQVLLKSALKSVNSIDEDNLLGTERNNNDRFDSFMDKPNYKPDKQSDKMDDGKPDSFGKPELLGREKQANKPEKLQQGKDQDELTRSPSPRKRNFKSNSLNLFNDQEMFEERTKKQKLSHLHDDGPEECFIDENSYNYNDDLTLNNLANRFIKLRTQHSHD